MNKQPIKFSMSGEEFCCGIYNIGNFSQAEYCLFNTLPKLLLSNEEVFLKFEETLCNYLYNKTIDSRDDYNVGGGYLVNTTLVTHYKGLTGSQFSELYEYLLLSGWEVSNVFRNRNTGNEVTQLSRFFTDEELLALQELYEDDSDEDDSDEDDSDD